jgi:hypothetical protein
MSLIFPISDCSGITGPPYCRSASAAFSNFSSLRPAIEISAEVLGEDIRWLCEVQPNQTLGWALDLIHKADCLTQAEDGYAVRYEY